MTKTKQDFFTQKMFFRQLSPALLAAVTLAFADMADALVVGQQMGATGLAAIGLCLPFFMVINVIMHGFGIGGSVRYATLLASGKNETASGSFRGVMMVALMVSVAFGAICYAGMDLMIAGLGATVQDGALYVAVYQYATIICLAAPIFFLSYILQYYLQNDNEEKVAGWGFSVGMVTDIASNIVLVLILDWGITGAAVATVLGNGVSATIYIITILRKKSPLSARGIPPDLRDGLKCFLAGASSSSRHLYSMAFLIIANRVLLHLSGEIGVAVLDVVQNASFFLYYLYDAVARSCQPLISTYHGEHNHKALASIRRLGTLFGHGLALVAVVIIFTAPTFVCGLFGLYDQPSIELATVALRIFCVAGFFGGANLLSISFAQSCSDEKKAFFITSLRGGIILLPATVFCSMLGVTGFWFLYPITEIVTTIVNQMRTRRVEKDSKPEGAVFAQTIYNNMEEFPQLIQQIETFCDAHDGTMLQNYYVLMAVEELCTAIMSKGFQGEDGLIQITLLVLEDGVFELHIRDSADSFNPFSLKTGKLGDDEDFDMDAMGVFAIKKRAKFFAYRQYQGFNTLVVRV